MAKPKVAEPEKNWLTELIEEGERRDAEVRSFPLLAERWWVDEKYPDWHEHSVYDSGEWHTGKTVNVSGYLDTEEEALKFIEDHMPDESDGKFIIRHQYLRTHTKVWNEWGWV